MGQGLFSTAKFGVNLDIRVKLGHQTGRQAFTTFMLNRDRQIEAEARRRLFRAAAYLRTTVRRSMKRKRTTVRNYKGYSWNSFPPSAPGSPPNRRVTGKSGLQDIRFAEIKKNVIRVGPEQYTNVGKKTSFRGKGDVFQEVGGTGRVMLPLDISQIPASIYHQVVTLKAAPWPLVPKTSRYPARPFMHPAIRPMLAKFPKIFTNLTSTKR